MNSEKFWLSFLTFLPLWDFCISQSCGSVLTESGVIVSRGHPASYPSGHNCQWTIQANSNDQVNILFKDFNIEAGENCEFDWLEITTITTSKKFCGEKLSDVGYNGRLQLRGSVKFHLVSDASVNLRGFSLQYQVVPGEPPPTTPPPTTPPPTTIPTTTPEPSLTCDDKPCENEGECSMIDEAEYYCFCEDGYEGTRCEIDIDECASNPCLNGATCVDEANSWSCECAEGFLGESCSIDIDDCLRASCKNGATCEDRPNSFFCACAAGWTAWDCGTEIDECNPDPCLNQGACEDHLGYHTCICHPKYTGANCSIPLDTESTELPEKYKTPALLTTAPTSTLKITTPQSLGSFPSSATLPESIFSTPSPNFQPEQNPRGEARVNSTDVPEIPTQTTTNRPFEQQTTTLIDDSFYANATNNTSENTTNSNVDSNETSGIPIPTIIGAVAGFMSFVGVAASIFRFCHSPARPMKVQPMAGGAPTGNGPYFEH